MTSKFDFIQFRVYEVRIIPLFLKLCHRFKVRFVFEMLTLIPLFNWRSKSVNNRSQLESVNNQQQTVNSVELINKLRSIACFAQWFYRIDMSHVAFRRWNKKDVYFWKCIPSEERKRVIWAFVNFIAYNTNELSALINTFCLYSKWIDFIWCQVHFDE